MRESRVTGIQRGVPRGLHGQIVEVMAQRILSGQIPEGATINVTELQSDLGVSLTAVREALKVLTAKGLVDARQKRGTFVRQVRLLFQNNGIALNDPLIDFHIKSPFIGRCLLHRSRNS